MERHARLACAVLSAALMCLLLSALSHPDEPRPRKKLIELGWDKPDSERLLKNLDVMEQQPFDGVVVHPQGQMDDGKLIPLRGVFVNAKWERRWFQRCIDNLARNGDFGSEKAPPSEFPASDWKEGGAPAGWHFWQAEDSPGAFTWDREVGASAKGSAKAANATQGCFIQTYTAQPGERYAIRARQLVRGRGEGSIRVRWQTAEGRWTAEMQDKLIFPSGPREQWADLSGVVEVPTGVGRLLILLGASGQLSPEDAVWYDDVEVCRLE